MGTKWRDVHTVNVMLSLYRRYTNKRMISLTFTLLKNKFKSHTGQDFVRVTGSRPLGMTALTCMATEPDSSRINCDKNV